MKKFLFVLLMLAALVVQASATVNVDAARLIPVLEGGRVKPLDSYARETVHNISGKSTLDGQDPLTSMFNWMVNPEPTGKGEIVLIDYLPLRTKLGFDPSKRRTTLEQIRNSKTFDSYIAELRRKPDNEQNKLDKEAGALFHRAMLLNDAIEMEIPLIPGSDPSQPWMSPPGVMSKTDDQTVKVFQEWVGMVQAFKNNDQAGFDAAAMSFKEDTKRLAGNAMVSDTHLATEEFYSKYRPAMIAWIFYLLAFLTFIGVAIAEKPHLRWTAVTLWGLGFAAHIAALGLRAYISGRAPWSNMYESMQMLAFGIMFFALMFEVFSKARIFLPASAVLGVIALIINDASPFDPFVSPLAPVLKSYWLTFHVMIMLLGYSACALAMGIGHFVLGYELWGKKDSQQLVHLDKALYRVVQVAMLFLVTGIILGAMWANESWGRYWGWDPKETWALITWFYYLAVAHGRFSNWWKRTGTAVLSIVGFPVVLMTYYGVNFFLVGLHSYAGGGAPEPMPPLAWFYLGFEIVFLLGFWYLRTKKLSAEMVKP
jgi:cytochrome c-type biogenesis protein CcsB